MAIALTIFFPHQVVTSVAGKAFRQNKKGVPQTFKDIKQDARYTYICVHMYVRVGANVIVCAPEHTQAHICRHM